MPAARSSPSGHKPVTPRSERPKRSKRVTFLLDTSTRTRNEYGADFYARILLMHLQGCTIREIARELGCDKKTVNRPLLTWQTQVEMVLEQSATDSCSASPPPPTLQHGPTPKII